MPQPLSQHKVSGVSTVGQVDSVPPRPVRQQPADNITRDAVVPGVDTPSISSAVTQLLASYDQQAVQDALPGKGQVNRRKSGRYNTTDTTMSLT